MRPKLTFETIRPSVNYYLRFDPATGNILGCSIEKKGDCIEIDQELGKQIKSGQKSFMNYKAVLINNEYVVKPKNFVESKQQTNIKTDHIENKALYRVQKNNKDSCIRFLLDTTAKKWIIKIDNEIRTTLRNNLNLKGDNRHNFYVVDDNNPNFLNYIMTLDIARLINDGTLQEDHLSNTIPMLYCRKIYNYSYEVLNV